MSDEQRRLLELALGGDPTDLSVYADWLDDHRLEPQLAHALHWCARRGKRPRTSPKGRRAGWERQPRRKRRASKPHVLPALVFDLLPGRPPLATDARLGAYVALAQALERLRRAYDVAA